VLTRIHRDPKKNQRRSRIMKSKLLLVPALILTGAVAACGAHSGAGAPAAANSQVVVVGEDTHGVAVLGRGEVIAVPDTAYIEVGIETQGPTVAAARASGAKAMNALLDTVVRNGVARKDIQTSQLSIGPRYEYDKPGGAARLIGYTMTTSVTVQVRDLDKLGKIVDDAAQGGGNSARVSGIRFTVDNDDALRDRAREAAISDARRKAEQLAKNSGAKLGNLVGIEEVSASMPPIPMASLAEADMARTPIERGSAKVFVEVRARWAISG
jgi:uncharacterized protein YggE